MQSRSCLVASVLVGLFSFSASANEHYRHGGYGWSGPADNGFYSSNLQYGKPAPEQPRCSHDIEEQGRTGIIHPSYASPKETPFEELQHAFSSGRFVERIREPGLPAQQLPGRTLADYTSDQMSTWPKPVTPLLRPDLAGRPNVCETVRQWDSITGVDRVMGLLGSQDSVRLPSGIYLPMKGAIELFQRHGGRVLEAAFLTPSKGLEGEIASLDTTKGPELSVVVFQVLNDSGRVENLVVVINLAGATPVERAQRYNYRRSGEYREY